MQQSSEEDLVKALEDPSFLRNKREKSLNEIANIFHSAFNTDSGKKALNILSLMFYAHKQPPRNEWGIPESLDPIQLAVRHGEKNVMQYIYDQMGRYRG